MQDSALPPSDRSPPFLRCKTDDDEAFCFELFIATRGCTLGSVPLPEEAFRGLLELQYEANRRSLDAVTSGARGDFIIEQLGRPVGRLVYREEADCIHLAEIALLPDAQGRGVGSAVIGRLKACAARSGKPLRLYCDRYGSAAGFYLKAGFSAVGETATDFLMEWVVPDPQEKETATERFPSVIPSGEAKTNN